MIGLVVVLAVALADTVVTNVPTVGASWLTPEFLTALAAVLAALGTLIAVLRGQSTAQAAHSQTQAKVDQVVQQTNGALATLTARNLELEKELAGVAHRAQIRSPTGASAIPGP